MIVFVLIVFGAFGLILIFMNFDFLMEGVAIGNSSASAGNYTAFNEIINAMPWIVPMLFVVMLGGMWWFSRKRR